MRVAVWWVLAVAAVSVVFSAGFVAGTLWRASAYDGSSADMLANDLLGEQEPLSLSP